MSHSSGKVYRRFGDLVGYFEYNGTSDVAMPVIFPTSDSLSDNWRNRELQASRRCECPVLTMVRCVADYGYGIEWEAAACLECMVIAERLVPDEYLPEVADEFVVRQFLQAFDEKARLNWEVTLW